MRSRKHTRANFRDSGSSKIAQHEVRQRHHKEQQEEKRPQFLGIYAQLQSCVVRKASALCDNISKEVEQNFNGKISNIPAPTSTFEKTRVQQKP
ncbi:hypothetical protein E2C01_044531 [Portunus trituberculatus]|uniref:Uncharacterized protein n=1 Tax=Portunus trituberculatus TaxID=210409 RepID=A0A5B7FTD3_PORTR|nr:hypothetical protein [Portunus trituberculatus]